MGYPFTSALVTGASSGIGAELARLLGEAGVPTTLVARRGDRLREIAERYDGFEVLEADLITAAGRAATAARIASTDEPVELVVNNAGFGTGGTFHEADVERLEDEVELNVRALTVLGHAALTAMIPRRRGYLLNVSSIASFQAVPGLAVYAATKAYVTSLTEALHAEAKPHGVHVTALCPGLTRTEFIDISAMSAYERRVPSIAWSSAADVAADGLRDVAANRVISVPGAVNKGVVLASDLMPRAFTRWFGSFGASFLKE